MKSLRLTLAAACLLISGCTATSSSAVTITNTPVPALKSASASMDVAEIDQKAHRLYVADRTDNGVDVFDITKPQAKYVETIALNGAPSGLAVAPDLARLFVGMSDGTVAFVDTTKDKVVTQVPTGGKSVDLIDYAAERHTVYASNSAEGTIAAVDVKSATRTDVFNIGRYSLEQPRYNAGDHMLYVTSPDADAIFPVDPNTGAVGKKLLLGGCRGRGMAIDPKHSQALVACTAWVIRMNLHQPTDASGFTQVSGGDVVSYDASVDRFFVASPGAKSSQVGVFGGNPVDYVSAVSTAASGNSAVYDETNGIVYTPDTVQGHAGVVGFKLPTGELTLGDIPPVALGAMAALILAILAIIAWLGRHADPKHRPAPEPPRAKPSREPVPGEIRAGARTWTRKT